MRKFGIELGVQARDKVTGYTGIVVGRTEWLYGCFRYTVQSQELKDGKPVEPMGFDEDALEVVGASIAEPIKAVGGPRDDAKRPAGVSRR